jgi:hypothetical protein
MFTIADPCSMFFLPCLTAEMSHCLVAVVVLFVTYAAGSMASQQVVIRNRAPRYANNVWIDAHDGNINYDVQSGLYYMYAMGYTNCTEQPTGCANAAIGQVIFALCCLIIFHRQWRRNDNLPSCDVLHLVRVSH